MQRLRSLQVACCIRPTIARVDVTSTERSTEHILSHFVRRRNSRLPFDASPGPACDAWTWDCAGYVSTRLAKTLSRALDPRRTCM